MLKSAQAFRKIVRDYAKYPRADAAMFALAKTLLQLENENAIIYFEKIIKDYKGSPLLPETYLALGEHYFYKHKMKKALEYYKQAIRFKESKVYTYAVYKLGWAFFNVSSSNPAAHEKNTNKAIAALKLVVKLSEKRGGKTPAFNLKQEAINDLIVVFADNRRTDEAMRYFRSIGENDAFYDMLERMGNQYVEIGETKKAIAIFNRLLTESPNRIRNPKIYLTLAAIYHTDQKVKQLVKVMETMDRLYVQGSSWTRANAKEKEKVEKAYKDTKDQIHRYSTLYHKQGMKGKGKPKLLAALQLYNLYLKSFPKSEEAYELRYYLAEIHFHFKNYDKAADEYYTVSQSKGKYLQKSALSAVISMKNIDEKQKYKKLPPLGQINKPIALPRVKSKFIKMIDNYVKLLPKKKDGHPMRYTAAYTLFEYGHYKPALSRFETIVSEIPRTKQGKSSVKMIIGYYSERKEWDQLIAVCRRFLKNDAIVNSKLKLTLRKTLKDSLFGQAVRYSKNKKYLKSAKAFVAYQEEFPKAKNAHDALYNATFNYYKDGKVEDAISKGKALLKRYPKSKHVRTVVLDIAQTNESLAEFKESAYYYEMYAKMFPKDKKSRLSLYNSATLYRGLKEYKKAVSLYNRFIRFYPKDKLSKSSLIELAQIYETTKDYNRAVSHYQKYAWQHDTKSETYFFAMAKSAEIQYQNGNRKGGGKLFGSLYKKLVKKDSTPAFDARRIIARSMFEDLNKSFVNFKGISVSNAKKIEKEVKFKQNRLKYLVGRYQDVIDLGSGEYTVASLYRVGEMHENFADELFRAPAPKGASQLEIDQYRSAIEKVAFPLREESEKYFEMALTRSKEVQTFTNWTRLAREKMTQINEDKYPLVNEKNVQPVYLSHRLIWQDAVAKFAP